MPKPKSKNWKAKTFSLDDEVIPKIPEFAKFEGMNESQFIEWLVMNYQTNTDPHIKLNSLINKKKEKQAEVTALDNEIKEISDQIIILNEIKRKNSNKKGEAIKIIEKIITEGETERLDSVSKIWQRLTGIPALQLVMEAKNNLEKKGI